MKKLELIRAAAAEAKLVRSVGDLKRLAEKAPFFLPRLKRGCFRDATRPLTLQIEPTNVCNINCICCPRARSRRPKGFMSLSLFQRLIDDAAGSGISRIHLYLHGEPFLHPRILDMIAAIKRAGLGFNLVTNGQLLDSGISERLLKCGPDISDYVVISVLGSTKAVHEQTMRGICHERVLRNAADLMALRRKMNLNGPVVQSIFYTLPENHHEAPLYLKQWKKLVDHAYCIGGMSQSFAAMGQSDGVLPLRRATCRNLWQRLTIYWNGDATICCEDIDGTCVFGNANTQCIGQLWTSPTLCGIKTAHSEKRFQDVELCARCDMGSWEQ